MGRALATLRSLLAHLAESPHATVRTPVRALRRLVHLAREGRAILSTPWRRALLWDRVFHPERVHQTTPLTWSNRYPLHFARAAAFLGNKPVRVLSFGCSTGEEVITLRQYLPAARIVGAEVNPASLAVCRRRPVDDRITFVRSTPVRVRRAGPYDAIFCMAVLQRKPHLVEAEGLQSIRHIYPFAQFDRQLRDLDAVLRPGGLMVVHHAQYRLSDSSIAHSYCALPEGPCESTDLPFFAPSGDRVPPGLPVPTMFSKLSSVIWTG
jgi:SAM-dependent methyltransferase